MLHLKRQAVFVHSLPASGQLMTVLLLFLPLAAAPKWQTSEEKLVNAAVCFIWGFF